MSTFVKYLWRESRFGWIRMNKEQFERNPCTTKSHSFPLRISLQPFSQSIVQPSALIEQGPKFGSLHSPCQTFPNSRCLRLRHRNLQHVWRAQEKLLPQQQPGPWPWIRHVPVMGFGGVHHFETNPFGVFQKRSNFGWLGGYPPVSGNLHLWRKGVPFKKKHMNL